MASGDDDNFGLPEINYKPLSENPEPAASVQQPAAEPVSPAFENPEVVEPDWGDDTSGDSGSGEPPASEEDNPEPYRPPDSDGVSPVRVLMFILIPLLLLAAGYFGYDYFVRQPELKKKALEETLKKEKAEHAKKEAEAARAREEAAAREAKPAEPPPPVVGTIDVLTGPTKRYYVVVASSLDGDLLMDKARQLSASGVSSKIIPPYGQWKFHRLGILDQETFALAQAKADEVKPTYGNDIWVIRY